MSFRSHPGVARQVQRRDSLSRTHRETAPNPFVLRHLLVPIPENQRLVFARDLQDRLGILTLLALSAPFRICKLQIPLVDRETDPVSGHHLESMAYKR